MTRRVLAPGARIGIVGGGQLGRMLGATALRMGYLPFVLAPEADPPAAHCAVGHWRASLDDADAVASFASAVDVLTFEFENVSSAALDAAVAHAEVRPSPRVLHLTQDRAREKSFLAAAGLPLAPARVAASPGDLPAAIAAVGTPCVVKSSGFGYDGKGQVRVGRVEDDGAMAAARALAEAGPVVVERFMELAAELSVVVARGEDGECAAYRPFVNRHVDHILDLTLAPFAAAFERGAAAGVEIATADLAVELALEVARRLEAIGLICVEFFLTTSGELLINEVAPRTHNSGHLTIEAAATSQFEQQLRAVCGLALGSTRLSAPAAMANLLGDLWAGGAPDFAAALEHPGVTLHLYGKSEARSGRKMGHLTAVAADVETAVATVEAARRSMTR